METLKALVDPLLAFILSALVSFLAGVLAGRWLMILSKSATRVKRSLPITDSKGVIWYAEVVNPGMIAGSRSPDPDVRARLSFEKIGGGEPRILAGKWYSSPVAANSGDRAATGDKITLKAGERWYLPIVAKILGSPKAEFLKTIPLNNPVAYNEDSFWWLDIGTWVVSVTLDNSRACWFVIHNRDTEPANLKVHGPFNTIQKAQGSARKMGIA